MAHTRTRPSIPFLLELLRLAVRKEAVAVYVVPWMPPTLRLDDRTVPLSAAAFTPEQSTALVLDTLDDAQRAALDHSREIQCSFAVEDVGRFRVHAFRRHGQPAMTVRPYALQAPTPRTFALPALACEVALADRGLLLVGSRSTSLRRDVLAALIEHRNRAGSGEIVIVEDASRFWHHGAHCAVRQAVDATQAADAALQRSGKPDEPPLAIAWGEVRDPSTMALAARAAAHALCLVAMPADNLLHCLQRAATVALADAHADALNRLAMSLHAVVQVRPVAAADGGRDLAAAELLPNSPEVAACLVEQDFGTLRAMLAGGSARGALGSDEHLRQLVLQGLVRFDTALRAAADPATFALRSELGTDGPLREAAAAPVTVDTAFGDLFATSAPVPDAFAFADLPPSAAAADTRFDSFDWPSPSSAGDPAASGHGLRGVQFRAFAPALVAVGTTASIDLWAALPGQESDLERLVGAADAALAAAPAAPADAADAAPVVMLHLRVDGLTVAQPVQGLAWQGVPTRARFEVSTPGGALVGAHAARVRASVDGVLIGELSFLLQVAVHAEPHAPPEDAHAARRMVQHVYAAYAVEDRAEVLASLRRVQQVAPDLVVFLDAPALRNNEQWRERIERELLRCERLALYWSADAADSPWVDFEWRLMLRSRGAGAIDLLLLDTPGLAAMPPELAELSPTRLAADAAQGGLP